MRFVSFDHGGRPVFGLLYEDAIVDLTGKLSPAVVKLKQAVAAGLLAQAAAWQGKPAGVPVDQVRLPAGDRRARASAGYARRR